MYRLDVRNQNHIPEGIIRMTTQNWLRKDGQWYQTAFQASRIA